MTEANGLLLALKGRHTFVTRQARIYYAYGVK